MKLVMQIICCAEERYEASKCLDKIKREFCFK